MGRQINQIAVLRIAVLVLLLAVHGVGLAAHQVTHVDPFESADCEFCAGYNKLDHAAADNCAAQPVDAPKAQAAARPATVVLGAFPGAAQARAPPLSF